MPSQHHPHATSCNPQDCQGVGTTPDNVAKAKVFDNITSRWNDITEDFANRGYISHDGIRYIVLPHARKLFAAYSPHLSQINQNETINPDIP
jgi:hypothetical protein